MKFKNLILLLIVAFTLGSCSLDLDTNQKKGVTTAGTFAAPLTTAAVADAQIAAGNLTEDNIVKVYLNTTAGDIDVNAAAITAVGGITDIVEGDKFAFVKASTDANRVTFTDPDGVTYNFVNRQSEAMCLVWDGATFQMDY